MADRCLSGGERKRVELASLLALPLRLAILDEPDSGIDMLSLDDVARVIRAFPQRGAAVLLITHREEIALVADRAAQLCRGRIADSGPPAQVAARYRALSCPACAAPEAAETGRCAGEEAAHG
jgi:Fe-S cluster assembly ATP-binding protein